MDDNDQQQFSRLMLAIALCMLVLMLDMWARQRRAPEAPPTADGSPTQVETAAPPAAPMPAGPVADATGPVAPPASASTPTAAVPAPMPVPAVEEPVIETVVDSPVLRLVFTSRGASITSAQLPQHVSKAGEPGPVELIPALGQDAAAPPDADVVRRSRALDLMLSDGRRLSDVTFKLTEYRPGSPAVAQALRVARGPIGAATGEDTPEQLRGATVGALRAAGVAPALAWSIGAAASDVPATPEGLLAPHWKSVAAATLEDLGAATVLDYSTPWTGGSELHKIYVAGTERYVLDVSIAVVNETGSEVVSFGGPDGYGVVWGPGIASAERSPSQDPQQFTWLYKGSLEQKTPGIGIGRRIRTRLGLAPELTIAEPLVAEPGAKWFALRRKYFMVGIRPMFTGTVGTLVSLAEPRAHRIELQVLAPELRAEPGDFAAHRYVICPSPIHRVELEAVGHDFAAAVNFGFFDLFGKAMLAGLLLFNNLVRNYGVAIILLTVLVRLGLYPLNQRAYQSMRAMSVMQPKISEVRERYKNDPQQMNKKIWDLYRENNINPLGGCLPIFFQMPIFLALFNALRGALELRGAEFLWIADLSEPDRLAVLPGGFALNILPLLMIGAMMAQQKMSTPPANPSNDPNAEMQRKMMTWMPLMFGVMFYGMPSGLTLYWLVSTLLGIGQQYYINKA